MTDKTIVQVSMNSQGVLSRRGFLRSVGLGAAGIAALSFTDLMALRAEELRKRRRACILLWMAGG
ncbi:MAG: twin-arginine translocation signal domain-containing protein, partial [Planctomycetaceae bacterium]|nr:twin-arginine translocation signal domain-containing protein [Planctomycetaceae bacterium]